MTIVKRLMFLIMLVGACIAVLAAPGSALAADEPAAESGATVVTTVAENPAPAADSSSDSTTDSTTDSSSDSPGCTSDCTPACTTNCTPTCTTNCSPGCTTNCSPPPCTVNCGGNECTVDCIPTDDCTTNPDSAACNPTLGEGAGPTPTAGAGRLPYTGPGDTFLQILLASIALLAGVMAFRYASVKERFVRGRDAAYAAMSRRPRTGYAGYQRNIDADAQAAAFLQS